MKKIKAKILSALLFAAFLMTSSFAMAQMEIPISTVYMNTHPTVMELPVMSPSAECGSLVIWDLYQKYPELQKELKEIKVLWQWFSATFQLHITKKLVKTMEDLKGLKIIAWNKTSVSILKALGANAIMLPPTDSYLALERGMADGILCPLAPIVSFKISEAVKYTTVCDIFVTPFWAVFGHQVWESLPNSVNQVLTETTGNRMARLSGLTLDEGAFRDSKKLAEKGITFYTLPAAEKALWLDATISLRETWVKERYIAMGNLDFNLYRYARDGNAHTPCEASQDPK